MRGIVLACAFVAALVLTPTSAQAAPPPTPPVSINLAMPHVSMLTRTLAGPAMLTSMTVRTSTASVRQMSPTSWCGTYWVTIYSYNGMHQVMWSYRMTVPWCWTTGVRIWRLSVPYTSVSIGLIANIGGWEFDGVQSVSQYQLDPTPHRDRSQTQAKFGLCPPRLFCLYHLYPHLTMDVTDHGQGILVSAGGTSL